LFKATFETPEQAAGLFKQLLPATLTEALAWDTLERDSGTFVDPHLRKRQSDLLFSVQLAHGASAGQTVLLYILLEHQSSNDIDMLLRMLEYLVRIWKRHRKSHPGPLPIIVPIVVSHAEGGWGSPTTFHDLFDLHPDAIPGLGELVPNFSLLLRDLTLVDDDELLSFLLLPAASLLLKTLRDSRYHEKLLHGLDKWRTRVREILASPGGREYIEQWLDYVWTVTPDLDFEAFRASILQQLPEAKEVIMTIAEQLHAKGRAEGEAKARVQLLTKQMALKFGPLSDEHIARITTATEQQLDLYIERILTALTPEALFAD
jgi:predicted transposase/invertase (TIGR01784 family)